MADLTQSAGIVSRAAQAESEKVLAGFWVGKEDQENFGLLQTYSAAHGVVLTRYWVIAELDLVDMPLSLSCICGQLQNSGAGGIEPGVAAAMLHERPVTVDDVLQILRRVSVSRLSPEVAPCKICLNLVFTCG